MDGWEIEKRSDFKTPAKLQAIQCAFLDSTSLVIHIPPEIKATEVRFPASCRAFISGRTKRNWGNPKKHTVYRCMYIVVFVANISALPKG